MSDKGVLRDSSEKAKVVVLGAGFGGLTFCQNFSAPNAEVTVVDRHNHHLFQPLLYQVATAGLAGPDIAQPIRSILRKKSSVTVLMEEVTGFNLARREVHLHERVLSYDYLVLALGSVTSYFGHHAWEKFAHGLKSLEDAVRLRTQVLLAFERAEMTASADEREKLLTMVVIGGGPTGVEVAGALAELARHVLAGDFRRIDPRQARIILIEAGPRLLATFVAPLGKKAREDLISLGVDVRTDAKVEKMGEGYLELAGGIRIESATIIWAAGVMANPLAQKLGVPVSKSGRVPVQSDLSLAGHENVFVIGDMAAADGGHHKPAPGLAPAAMQMARHTARIIENELRQPDAKKSRPAFKYYDKGTMATIGRSRAVAQIGKIHFSGWLAWMGWLFVHLLFIVGFRNKATVFLQWMYSYATYTRGSRVIPQAAVIPASIQSR